MKMIWVLFFWFSTFSVNGPGQEDMQLPPPSNSAKILIVYLSRTNNTKAVAKLVQEQIGGTLVALELENLYPGDYDAIVKQVEEENEKGC